MNKCLNCSSVLIEHPHGRKKMYCNSSCRRIYLGNSSWVDRPKNCLFCGEALELVFQAGTPKKFCSKKHRDNYRVANTPKKLKVAKSCLFCSKEFMTALDHQKYCCRDCLKSGNSKIYQEKREAYIAANPRRHDFNCDRCNMLVLSDVRVTKGSYGRYCRNCALVLRRERYRVKTAKRQNVLNPVRMSADVLIERDGNVCHICLTEIDLSLARNSRFGATIDHVIPVSRGGADTLENMKLAHWICNIKKGNRV